MLWWCVSKLLLVSLCACVCVLLLLLAWVVVCVVVVVVRGGGACIYACFLRMGRLIPIDAFVFMQFLVFVCMHVCIMCDGHMYVHAKCRVRACI